LDDGYVTVPSEHEDMSGTLRIVMTKVGPLNLWLAGIILSGTQSYVARGDIWNGE